MDLPWQRLQRNHTHAAQPHLRPAVHEVDPALQRLTRRMVCRVCHPAGTSHLVPGADRSRRTGGSPHAPALSLAGGMTSGAGSVGEAGKPADVSSRLIPSAKRFPYLLLESVPQSPRLPHWWPRHNTGNTGPCLLRFARIRLLPFHSPASFTSTCSPPVGCVRTDHLSDSPPLSFHLRCRPVPGTCVVFPSFVPHFVSPVSLRVGATATAAATAAATATATAGTPVGAADGPNTRENHGAACTSLPRVSLAFNAVTS